MRDNDDELQIYAYANSTIIADGVNAYRLQYCIFKFLNVYPLSMIICKKSNDFDLSLENKTIKMRHAIDSVNGIEEIQKIAYQKNDTFSDRNKYGYVFTCLPKQIIVIMCVQTHKVIQKIYNTFGTYFGYNNSKSFYHSIIESDDINYEIIEMTERLVNIKYKSVGTYRHYKRL
jgi:hypothetical protein